MNKTEIKKELYKQKPTADFNKEYSESKQYSCQIEVEGQMKPLYFRVPLDECEFEETVPTQLLIRWLI